MSFPALRWIYRAFTTRHHMVTQHSICSVINNFTNSRYVQWVSLDKSIVKVVWQLVSAGGKRKKKQGKETSQGKVENWVMEWENEAGFRGRQAVRSFCPAQPVDFRQEKTEMVYSENAISAQFHLRALETWGGKIRTFFKVRSCFL